MTAEKALHLAALGLPVFPVRATADSKTPLTPRGHLDATLNTPEIKHWWNENPNAEVGVYVGAAGLTVLDVDMKNGKDGWESLDQSWLDIPETFGYDTPSGGRHLVYTAPADTPLKPTTNYRGMVGVDTRAGSSWVLWNGPVPTSRTEFTDAPEWLLDQATERTGAEFEGNVQEWYDTLVQGPATPVVAKAQERISKDS